MKVEVVCEYTVVVRGVIEVPYAEIMEAAQYQLKANYDLVENGHKTAVELLTEFFGTESERLIEEYAMAALDPGSEVYEADSFRLRSKEIKA